MHLREILGISRRDFSGISEIRLSEKKRRQEKKILILTKKCSLNMLSKVLKTLNNHGGDLYASSNN
jgi:hypothetical protein